MSEKILDDFGNEISDEEFQQAQRLVKHKEHCHYHYFVEEDCDCGETIKFISEKRKGGINS